MSCRGDRRRISLTPLAATAVPPTVRARALNVLEITAHTWKE